MCRYLAKHQSFDKESFDEWLNRALAGLPKKKGPLAAALP
jgi:hypothetical protein